MTKEIEKQITLEASKYGLSPDKDWFKPTLIKADAFISGATRGYELAMEESDTMIQYIADYRSLLNEYQSNSELVITIDKFLKKYEKL